MKPLTELGIELVVFDMAGTTVDEGGLVYSTLKKAMRESGLKVDNTEFDMWHGANKKEVIAHFVQAEGSGDIDSIYEKFETLLESEYFIADSPLKAMPGITDYFQALRSAGIKVALDTGFPRKIADRIIAKLQFSDFIDASCVAMEVGAGRPYPYMIYFLMKQLGIMSVRKVVKVGDTVRDIEEGANAGTPYTIGCLSGADNRQSLEKAGAYCIVDNVTDIPI